MAKGKKSSDKKGASNGIHCQNKSFERSVRQHYKKSKPFGDLVNLVKEWKAGKNPWLTIKNPNDKNTRARYVRIRANDHWGDYKQVYLMKSAGNEG